LISITTRRPARSSANDRTVLGALELGELVADDLQLLANDPRRSRIQRLEVRQLQRTERDEAGGVEELGCPLDPACEGEQVEAPRRAG
jgi:hypothetical protein